MIHGFTIAINSTSNCDRVPLSHLHYVQYPQKSSTVEAFKTYKGSRFSNLLDSCSNLFKE